MFRCGKCNQLSQPGEPAVRVVTENRDRTYPYREYAMKKGRGANRKWIADPGGVGFEVAKEELRHDRCQPGA